MSKRKTRKTIKSRFREPEPVPTIRVICATLGPGKARLLQRLDESGSLSQAAREMVMTYRQAWLMLAEMNEAFQHPVADSFTGGVGGGGMRLTDTGKKVLSLYQTIHASCEKAASRPIRTLHGLLKR